MDRSTVDRKRSRRYYSLKSLNLVQSRQTILKVRLAFRRLRHVNKDEQPNILINIVTVLATTTCENANQKTEENFRQNILRLI